jgi:dimethylaniline monooxygenase (N-oxide forming)
MSKRVAVIGVGPSGLCTTKELLTEGHLPTCFERSRGIGGVFRFDENDGVVWESCRLTSSGLLTAFSDFPVSLEEQEHMTATAYVGYLQRYCDQFDLTDHIRFETSVESVQRGPEAGWLVRSVGPTGERLEEHYDAVAICSGLHQHPHAPTFPGQEEFAGTIMHGSEYRRPAQVAGKRVLVVGAGESGGDIVGEIAEAASETVLSLRRGVAVLPRKIGGVPNDYYTTRLQYSTAHWVFQTRNPKDRWRRDVFRALSWTLLLPFKLLESLYLTLAWLVGLAHVLRARLSTRTTEGLTKIRMAICMRRLLKESGGTGWEQFGTKTESFVRAIVNGRCRRVGRIARFDRNSVIFEDGSSFEPDVVILCTGVDPKVPFLDGDLATEARYMHTFVPSVGAGLGFIGFLRPGLGAIPPMAELQARWFALLLSERLQLPDGGEMESSIDQVATYRRDFFRAVKGRLDYLVDYTWFCDELAGLIGCKPTEAILRSETPRFRRRFFAGPFVAAQYRLHGPHAKPELARQIIVTLPTIRQRAAIVYWYVTWSFCRLLSRVLGARFAPRLQLSQ